MFEKPTTSQQPTLHALIKSPRFMRDAYSAITQALVIVEWHESYDAERECYVLKVGISGNKLHPDFRSTTSHDIAYDIATGADPVKSAVMILKIVDKIIEVAEKEHDQCQSTHASTDQVTASSPTAGQA